MSTSTPVHIVVAGKVNDASYQEAKEIAKRLASRHSNVTHENLPFFETDWEDFAKKASKKFGVEVKRSPVVYYNGSHHIGSLRELDTWARSVYRFEDTPNRLVCANRAKKEYREMMAKREHPFCYLDVSVGGDIPRRVVVELFESVCPKTCKNFIDLCTGENGVSYSGTPFHRVVPGGWIQGGDVEGGSGSGGSAAAGGTFADECFAIKHSRPGILSMANNAEPHSNGSQFFVTLAPLQWLDCKFVAFGRVISGLRVFRLIEKLKLNNERPVEPCVVVGCGIFSGEKRHATEYPEFESKMDEEGKASEDIDDAPTLPEDTRSPEEQERCLDDRSDREKLQCLSDAWIAMSRAGRALTRKGIADSKDIFMRFLPGHAKELAWVFQAWGEDSFNAEVTKSQFVAVGMSRVLCAAGGRKL